MSLAPTEASEYAMPEPKDVLTMARSAQEWEPRLGSPVEIPRKFAVLEPGDAPTMAPSARAHSPK